MKYFSLLLLTLLVSMSWSCDKLTQKTETTTANTLVNSSAAALKVGIVDVQKVILEVEEGKQARANLEKEIKQKEQDLIAREKEIKKLGEDLKAQAALLSEGARQKKLASLQGKIGQLQQDKMGFNVEVKRKEQQATQSIAQKVSEIVESMAATRGLSVVFETSSSGLMYVKDPVDLTADVIKIYASKPPLKTASAKK